jgi:pyruvate formate lyase activating enzyme
MTNLADVLDPLTAEGALCKHLQDGAVRCLACGHRCLIREGRRGICRVRFNRDGELRVPWGYVAALQSDPIEKKPFFHVLPGSNALTFGMLGCDYHCSYCQNWVSSQALRDPAAGVAISGVRRVTPRAMVDFARRTSASLVVSSYNEPLITTEWAVDIFKEAKEAGLICAFVSNGNSTSEGMEYLRPYLSAFKVDLKCMQDRNYRSLGGVLQNTLDGIRRAKEMGLWVEVVTLTVPGFNDSNEELWDAARFIAGVSPDIPWHVTAFHKDYRMTGPDNTDARTLVRAAEIGREAGLHYVYAGNLPGSLDEYENTYCPQCRRLLIRRSGYIILEYNLTGAGTCPGCKTLLPGIWPADPAGVRRDGFGLPIPVY